MSSSKKQLVAKKQPERITYERIIVVEVSDQLDELQQFLADEDYLSSLSSSTIQKASSFPFLKTVSDEEELGLAGDDKCWVLEFEDPLPMSEWYSFFYQELKGAFAGLLELHSYRFGETLIVVCETS